MGGRTKADLVERLSAEGAVRISLVTEYGGAGVGHVLFSALAAESGGMAVSAAALAPVAVLPDRQGQGLGSALIREGIARCRQDGVSLVVVLGDPAYYRRFGFSSACGARLRAPFAGDALMAVELEPGALGGDATTIRYAAAFGAA